MKKYNYLTSAILIFVGIMMIYLTKDFPFEGLQDVGGGFFPKLIGGLLIVLSVLVIVDTAVKPEGELTIDFKDPGMQKVLIMCGIMVVYCVIMKLAYDRDCVYGCGMQLLDGRTKTSQNSWNYRRDFGVYLRHF